MSGDIGTDDDVRKVLSSAKTIAIVGATNRESMPVHGVMNYMISQGYKCIPINPREAENGGEILGQKAVGKIADISEKVDMVDVFLRSDRIPAAVDDAIAAGAGAVWTQLDIEVDEETIAKAKAAGMTVITNRCPAIEIPRLGITKL
eukprot:CAMPEP_0181324190 /NCGR_PEP_ID=MMETSP1101-20121128/20218_1 /TAXON_ID=46948 /ORGANISM="Rhodomonas abbreviata, Strain Caron Lab Isolate" /LENGTH=146 /DNA_ID=CAMNT_0023432331 /DNA_START=237 /DNA_END=677 /DNA_ORIENTATION=-